MGSGGSALWPSSRPSASALATFLILAGLTPVLPTHDVVLTVFGVNAILVLFLLGMVAWQRQDTAPGAARRRRRRGAARAHRQAVRPDRGAAGDPRGRSLRASRSSGARTLVHRSRSRTSCRTRSRSPGPTATTQCRTLARETQLMAADLNRAKPLFDADRNVFREFMKSRATFLGFPIVDDAGTGRNGRRKGRGEADQRASRNRLRRILPRRATDGSALPSAACRQPLLRHAEAAGASGPCAVRGAGCGSARGRVPAGRRGGRRHLRGARTEEGRACRSPSRRCSR